MTTGRLPRRSESPLVASSMAPSPTANTVSAIPAHSGSRPSATATNSGTSATRTPCTAHPVARPELSAARYIGRRSARPIVSGSTEGSGARTPTSVERASRPPTTAVASTSATA
jgi:hypothetical protein